MDINTGTKQFTSTLFPILIVGILINWIPLFSGLIISFTNLKEAGISLLIIPLFLLLLPIWYYRMASDLAKKRMGRYFYNHGKIEILSKVSEVIQKKIEERGDKKQIKLDLSDFEKHMEKMPKALRFLLSKVAKKIPFLKRPLRRHQRYRVLIHSKSL